MKIQFLSMAALALSLANPAVAQSPAKQIYLNENIGFNVSGYNYAQAEYPCDLDKVLVEQIVRRGESQGIDIEAVGTADKLFSGERPVLAIDIDGLVLNEDFSFGMRTQSTLPSVRVTAALIKEDSPDGFITAQHSCSIATLSHFTPSSSVLDMGAYGHTVCSATRTCLRDLSRDIVRWVDREL